MPTEATRRPSIRIAEVSTWALLIRNRGDADPARIDALDLEMNGATMCGPFWETVCRRIRRLEWQSLSTRIAKALTAREDSYRKAATARLRENFEIEARRRGYWFGYAAPEAVALYLYRKQNGRLDPVMRTIARPCTLSRRARPALSAGDRPRRCAPRR